MDGLRSPDEPTPDTSNFRMLDFDAGYLVECINGGHSTFIPDNNFTNPVMLNGNGFYYRINISYNVQVNSIIKGYDYLFGLQHIVVFETVLTDGKDFYPNEVRSRQVANWKNALLFSELKLNNCFLKLMNESMAHITDQFKICKPPIKKEITVRPRLDVSKFIINDALVGYISTSENGIRVFKADKDFKSPEIMSGNIAFLIDFQYNRRELKVEEHSVLTKVIQITTVQWVVSDGSKFLFCAHANEMNHEQLILEELTNNVELVTLVNNAIEQLLMKNHNDNRRKRPN